MMKWSFNLSSLYSLDSDFSSSCIGKSQPKNMYNISINMKPSWLTWIVQGNNVLGNNFNGWCNQAHMHLPLAWHNKYISHTIHWHLFSDFSPFRSPVKEEGKQWRMKGLIIAQWININWNKRCVLAHWYSVLWEKKLALSSYHYLILQHACR